MSNQSSQTIKVHHLQYFANWNTSSGQIQLFCLKFFLFPAQNLKVKCSVKSGRIVGRKNT